jgi:hypothetical protein
MKRLKLYLATSTLVFFFFNVITAQNPIILDQFTADPSARVFGNTVYLYPSHDILAKEGKGRTGWFCMADYHVFSSKNLTDWTDHGIILSQNKVKWADSTKYSMWAPDCIFKNGKYYFVFPALPKDTSDGRGFSIGTSISEKPAGPFKPLSKPIKNVHGIDPEYFIDKDGQAYLYWALGEIYGAKLKENMTELVSEPKILASLPNIGLKEGPYLFERAGIYYLTYPHVQNNTERLEYATGDNPLGPFVYKGVIMDELPNGCWTNQQSIINYRDQWYLFYHQNTLSPKFDKNRSVSIDSLFFDPNGDIRKVRPTLRGVGLTAASKQIQTDRYSSKSMEGTSVVFMDSLNTFKGWETVFTTKNAWIQYNRVDFRNGPFTSLNIMAKSEKGGGLTLRLNDLNGPVVTRVAITAGSRWKEYHVAISKIGGGINNIILQMDSEGPVEVDWLKFNK